MAESRIFWADPVPADITIFPDTLQLLSAHQCLRDPWSDRPVIITTTTIRHRGRWWGVRRITITLSIITTTIKTITPEWPSRPRRADLTTIRPARPRLISLPVSPPPRWPPLPSARCSNTNPPALADLSRMVFISRRRVLPKSPVHPPWSLPRATLKNASIKVTMNCLRENDSISFGNVSLSQGLSLNSCSNNNSSNSSNRVLRISREHRPISVSDE